MTRQVKITATELVGYMDGDDLGQDFTDVVENILEDMKATPGGGPEEITLTITNDLEPEEKESEDEESEDTETKKEA